MKPPLVRWPGPALAHYVHLRLAVGVYWLNILLLGAGLAWGARYGRKTFVLASAQARVIALAIVQLYFIVSPRLPALGNRAA